MRALLVATGAGPARRPSRRRGHEAVDRHAASARRDRVALRFVGRDGRERDVSYGELAGLTGRFANVLAGLGVGRGGRVLVPGASGSRT